MKKRIALAAVAALAGGLIVAAPASAVATANQPFKVGTAVSYSTGSSATETATAIAGAYNFVALTNVSGSTPDTITAGGMLEVTGGTFVSTNVGTLNTAKTAIVIDSATVASADIRVATPAAGAITVVYKSYAQAGGVVTYTTQQTFTITVLASATGTVYNHTTLGALAATAPGVLDAAGALFGPKGTAGTYAQVGSFSLTQYESTGDTVALGTTSTKAISVSVTGVGAVKDSVLGATPASYVVVDAAASNARTINVYNDGRAGVATITISVNGAVVGTKTVTFWGDVASYTATISKAQIAPLETATITAYAKDANGVVVPGASIVVTSATTAAATVVSSPVLSNSTTGSADLGKATAVVAGVAKGTSVITLANLASAATVTTTLTANVVTAGVSTVAVAFDKAEYAPGEKATITVTAKNADGVLAADSTYANLFAAAATSTSALQGTLPAASVATVNGVATYTVYMPLAAGPISVSATLGTSVATAAQGTTVSASAKVVAPVDATVTAINAKVASTEATVAALQVTVASVIKSLKVQWWLLKKIAVKVGIKLG